MSVDPSVVQALEAAVAAAPESLPLRVHLAGLLLEAGRPAEALGHCQVALSIAPDDAAALALAATSARLSGNDTRADAYERFAAPATTVATRAADKVTTPPPPRADVLSIRVLDGGDVGEVH